MLLDKKDRDEFRQLIYTKLFPTELTHKLLKIADSKMFFEDLLEFIEEVTEEVEIEAEELESCVNCASVESEKSDIEGEFDEYKGEVEDMASKIEDLISDYVPRKKEIPRESMDKLISVKCECGNELTVDSQQKGWKLDIRGSLEFECPCGKKESIGLKE